MNRKKVSSDLRDLIEIIQFTESVAAKIHGVLSEEQIFRKVCCEFAKSKKYTSSFILLTKDDSKMRVANTSLANKVLKKGEKVAGVRAKSYRFDLAKSKIFRQVVKEGKTLHRVEVISVLKELFPRPLAFLLCKAIKLENKESIVTPLRRHNKIIGAFAMTSTELAEYFVPSVKNLSQHISTALDLAEENTKREKLVESQKEFITSLGHELRTPLSVIKVAAESKSNDFELINGKVDQISQIIRNLMLVSRLEIGQEKLEKSKFSLRDLGKSVLRDVLKEAQQQKIRPKITLHLPEKIIMRSDETKLALVLTNLLRNALFHSKSHPRIILKAKKQKNNVRIVVEDNNRPIPQEEVGKVFEKFYQDGQTRKGTNGLGLGLYISKQLVGLLKGQIWLETKKNRGNKFIIQLPISS